jgi:type IV pilus assembly protein PilC
MEFRCRLGTAGGQIVEGVYVAPSEAALRRELEDKGLHVLALAPRGAVSGLALRRRTIKRHEFLIFNQELATLLKAGMPLVQSLDILRQRLTNPVFKAVLDDVHEKVRGGTALSDAFSAHADLFSGVYTASLVAGERSGNLDTVLRRFVAYSKVIDSVRRKTISALLYPVILILLAVVLVAIIVVRVVPAFSGFYASFDQELPWITRVIIAVSNVVLNYLWLWVPALAVAAVGFLAWVRRPGQRARLDRLLLRIPMLGPIAHKFATSQIARTLAALVGGGIPLVNAIETAATSTANRYLGDELRTVAVRVREGRGFAATLLEREVVPDVAIKMIEVGESTGALQEMLTSLADFYDEDVETEVGRFVTLIEPVLLLFMGVVIAGVVLALYLPIFQLSSVMGR